MSNANLHLEHRSYSDVIIAAVNGYFGRKRQLADNPYLETREKEDAFLRRGNTGTLSVSQTWMNTCEFIFFSSVLDMNSENSIE